MKRDQDNFFARMKASEHSGFEIAMFSISIVVSVVVFFSLVMLGYAWYKANSDKITDEEANASSVTESAIEEEDTPEPINASGNAIVNEDDIASPDLDRDLLKKEFGYTTAVVNLRSLASLTSDVITKIPIGTRVKMIELEEKEWMKVEYEGDTGYINAMYLSAHKPKPAETIEPAEPTTAPVKRTPSPVVTQKPKKTPRPEKTKKPKKTAKPVKDPPEDEDDEEVDDEDYDDEEPEKEEKPVEEPPSADKDPVKADPPTEKPKPTEPPAQPPTEPPAEEQKTTPDIGTEAEE